MKMKLPTLILTVLGIWIITIGLALNTSKSACASPGKGGMGSLSGDNCAWVGSCGPKVGCIRLGFGGGSQYVYDNRISACLQDPHKNCYNVKCHVKQYTDEACRDLDDDTYIDRRGCRK